MADDDKDSWLGVLGVDVGQIRSKVQSVVQTVQTEVNSAVDTVVDDAKQLYQSGERAVTDVVQNVEDAGSTAAGALKSAVKAATGGASSGPIGADCKPVHGKVPGPAEHLLCATHGHILDVKAGQIIAASLDEYKRLFRGGVRADLPDPTEARKAAEQEADELKKDAEDAADAAKKELSEDADKAVEKLKKAVELGQDLLIKIKALGEAIAKDTEGCRLQAAAIAAAVVTCSAGIAAIVFPAPADASPAAPVAATVQLAGIVAAVMGAVGLIAAIASYINCKEDQVETLSKQAAQDRHNTETDEKIKKLQQQIDDIKKRKQDLQNSIDAIKALSQ